jgi:hypothetical protein
MAKQISECRLCIAGDAAWRVDCIVTLGRRAHDTGDAR